MKKKQVLMWVMGIALLGGGGAGCSDFIDVNHSPDALEEIPTPDVLLPATQINIGTALMSYAGIGTAMYVQYWTAAYTHAQFKALCGYDNSSLGNNWHILYTGALINLKAIKDAAAKDPSILETEKGAYDFIAEALSIYAWQVLTDLYGSIPYFEALQGSDNLHPKFDEQQAIYADLTARVNALLGKDVSAFALTRPDFDIVYGGDMSKWVAFANALKVKLMLRLSETSDFDLAGLTTHLDAAIAEGTLLADNARIPASMWDDNQEGKRHPLREYQAGGADYINAAVIMCKSLTDYLTENDDPRGQGKTYYRQGSGQPGGAFFGDFDNASEDSDNNGTRDDNETWARPVWASSTASVFAPYLDLMLISKWEVAFYAAEVYALSNDLAKAKEWYETGVKASLTQQGIASTAILGAGGYAQFTATTTDAAIEQIGMQRWVAHVNYQHIESFLERNRTKIPAVANEVDIAANRRGSWTNFPVGKLTISVDGRNRSNMFDGQWLPASPLYPTAVLERNSNKPSQKVDMGRPVWWNKKTEK